MRITSYLLAAALVHSGCTAAQSVPEDIAIVPSARTPSAAQSSPKPQLAAGEGRCSLELAELSEAERTPSPVYLVYDEKLFRVDALGTRRIDGPLTPPGSIGHFAGPRGTLWVRRGDGVFVIGPTDRTLRRVAPPPPWNSWLVARGMSDIWAIRLEAIAHYDGATWSTWSTEQLFGAVPRNIETTQDAVFAVVDGRVLKADIAGGVPVRIAIHQPALSFDTLLSSGRQVVVAETGLSQSHFEHCLLADFWRCAPGVRRIAIVGPSGMVEWRDGALSAAADPTCIIKLEAPIDDGEWQPDFSNRARIDGNNRLWVPVVNGFRVFDKQGAVVAEYRAGMLEGIDGPVTNMIVPGGGPKGLPPPKKRRMIDVAGSLSLHRSSQALGGATLTLHIGAGVKRTATSDASGAFILSDVPEGDYEVTVTPRPGDPACRDAETGFQFRTAHDCAASKVGSGACDLGSLSQCKPKFRAPRF